MDVVVDEAKILGHLGVDARAIWESTTIGTPVTHDAHLRKATGCTTHQWATVIPLWKHKKHTDTLI